MSLYTVVAGNQINAADLNQVVNMLQQPSGGTETDNWYLSGNAYTNGCYIGAWIPLTSHNSVPASISDTTSVGPSGSLGSAQWGTPNSGGILVYAQFSASSTNGYVGGTVTFHF